MDSALQFASYVEILGIMFT